MITVKGKDPMMIANNLKPYKPTHPGEVLKDELEFRGISQRGLAKKMGISYSALNEVLNGKRALTTDLAVKIESAIGLPAKVLLAAQTQYELESAKSASDNMEKETIAITIPISDRNLLRELVRRFGWVGVF